MQKKLPSLVLLLGMISTLLVMPMTTFAQGQGQGGGRDQAPGQNRGSTSNVFPVTGTGVTSTGVPADFTGQFTVNQFTLTGTTLNAVGSLVGTVNAAGVSTDVPARDVTLPVKTINGKAPSAVAETPDLTGEAELQIAQVASCDILNLVLGPLHLDLLGLVVDLNQVILNITGQAGPGNLLGNLLCAVAGLLDRNGTLQIITNLLNAILDILRLPPA